MIKNYHKIVLRIFIVVFILALLAAVGGVIACLNCVTANSEPVRIYLPPADNDYAITDTLRAHDLMGNEHLFNLMAGPLKLREEWREGSYVVQPHTPVYRLIKRITRGQQDPIRLTIGKFRLPQQLNEYLNQKLMYNDFNVTLDSFYIIRPDTYEFYWTVTPEQFMQRMKKEYEHFWSTRALNDPNDLKDPKDLKDLIIIASIVEEETNYNPEKPLIASVYLNRLKRGMPLQADPTVKYAVGDFTLRRILNKHLAVESPFNTYLHTGLPPAPICLPSQASIDAVLNAPETQYIYFCASEKLDGTHRFAATLAEHNRNAARYHAAIR